MKKIILSLFLLSLFSISCESDDGITYQTPDYLTATWKFNNIGTINAQNVLVYQDYINEATCEADNLRLNADKTFSLNDFTLTGQNCVNESISGTYTLLNRDLTLIYLVNNIEVKTIYSIVSLTNTELVVSTLNDVEQIVFYKLLR